jgi:hypothetical protein
MTRGEQAKSGPFFEFFHACDIAEHNARLNYTFTIAKAAQDGDWRAALEYLKRRDPANWSDNTPVAGGENKIEVVVRYADSMRNDTDPTR